MIVLKKFNNNFFFLNRVLFFHRFFEVDQINERNIQFHRINLKTFCQLNALYFLINVFLITLNLLNMM